MSDRDSIKEQLQRSALGTGLSDRHLSLLAELATRSGHPAGHILFSEGCAADSVSVVCSGSVALDMHVPLRGKMRILSLGPGDLLGWSAVVGDGVMTATATVVEDAVILDLNKTLLRNLCDADHTLGYAVMNLVARSLARRLRGTRLQMLDLFSETEPSRSLGLESSGS